MKPSVLPPGVRFRGEVEGEGDLIVFGQIEGPVRVDGGLVIEEGGLIRGHVHARQITIRGALKGDAFGDESIRVDASGRLVGDLTAPRVRVTPGAQFSGQVHVQVLDAAPPLRSYDPALHTFTGLPAPEPISEALAAGMTIPAPPPDDGRRPPRERPSRKRATRQGSDADREPAEPKPAEPKPAEARTVEPQAAETKDETEAAELGGETVPPEAVAEAAPRTDPAPPRAVGRMPRIGRVKGSHRPRR